jgi:hypothetical protein
LSGTGSACPCRHYAPVTGSSRGAFGECPAGLLLDGDPAALDAALAGYADAHDAATTDDFHLNFGAAHLGPPPPEVLAQRAALRGDQSAINRCYLER